MKTIISALSFFTIVRLPGEKDMASALSGAAIAGLLVGAGLALIYKFTGSAAPFLMVAWLAAVSGFLHLDGLSDTFDALFSHRSKEKMLEIMKDSRIGAMGAAALILCLLGKYHAFTGTQNVWLLVAIPSLCRFLAVLSGMMLPYARSEGLGSYFTSCFSPRLLLQIIPAELIILISAGPFIFLTINAAAGAVLLAITYWYKRTISGITGDGMGALIELSELALFLLVSVIYA